MVLACTSALIKSAYVSNVSAWEMEEINEIRTATFVPVGND